MRPLLLALTIALLAAGCTGGEERDYGTQVTDSSPKPKSAEEQIKEIEANPNVPPASKAAAIAGLRRGSAMGNAQSAAKAK